jgi:spore maturation protein A
MLNYVWIGLIAIGILVAVGNDINDEVQNTYRNGVPLDATMTLQPVPSAIYSTWKGELSIPAAAFNQFYGIHSQKSDVHQQVVVVTSSKVENPAQGGGVTTLTLPIGDSTPEFWKKMANDAGGKDQLSADVRSLKFSGDHVTAQASFVLEKVNYVKVRAVTKAALDYANTAVTISLGLIGIMALWLGVMKVAEEAGLLRILTKLLTPLTRRLFPEVPPDHPAVGAMIMNVAANMLGLNNAATPLGLKAMEELNKLNPKVGTATNAMCTFLVINTAGLTFIPATAIAVRAAAGSADPGIIIGTSIFGATCATIAGLIAVKVLQRLPWYKVENSAPVDTEAHNG